MIDQILENAIIKEQAEHKKKERSGLFNPSAMGRCYRYIYWNRKNEEQSNPVDVKVLRYFRAGNIYHRDLQSLLPPNQIEVEVKVEDFHMFVDWLGEDFVADFKTVNQFVWKKMCGDKYDVDKDKYPNIMQVMVECYLLEKPLGILFFVNKDNYEIKSCEFVLVDWKDRVEEELRLMREDWSREQLPPAKPRAYNGRECSYCVFRDKCKKTESA